MTNDIAAELALLHTLKGADFVKELKAITGRREFHALEDDPCIYTVGGEHEALYKIKELPKQLLNG